mmetsp:Transcript_31586/g.38372  ORF Transcript_31586/g.38372 Transcript_31586/m.38372 type:complete len:984 (-) Transcript_31586:357-3308(-)
MSRRGRHQPYQREQNPFSNQYEANDTRLRRDELSGQPMPFHRDGRNRQFPSSVSRSGDLLSQDGHGHDQQQREYAYDVNQPSRAQHIQHRDLPLGPSSTISSGSRVGQHFYHQAPSEYSVFGPRPHGFDPNMLRHTSSTTSTFISPNAMCHPVGYNFEQQSRIDSTQQLRDRHERSSRKTQSMRVVGRRQGPFPIESNRFGQQAQIPNLTNHFNEDPYHDSHSVRQFHVIPPQNVAVGSGSSVAFRHRAPLSNSLSQLKAGPLILNSVFEESYDNNLVHAFPSEPGRTVSHPIASSTIRMDDLAKHEIKNELKGSGHAKLSCVKCTDVDPSPKKRKSLSQLRSFSKSPVLVKGLGKEDESNESDESEESRQARSLLPQNLRGDPFRSAKVKTELCRHYGTVRGCPFGDKCNYAHGSNELKYTKLLDLERAALIDIEIFRTHACPNWVSTGGCPFDQRCSGLHDPRVSGSASSWLPYAETLVNSTGSSVNVDKLYHQQLSALYSCSPLYGFIPSKKWSGDLASTYESWRELYSFICKSNHCDIAGQPQNKIFGSSDKEFGYIFEMYQISIALDMREKKLAQNYAFYPTHIICGELCMVLQKGAYQIVTEIKSGNHKCSKIEKIEIGSVDDEDTRKNTIIAHEIAFGSVGDPGVRPISIFFNVPKSEITLCTPQQAKRHKRSRHRLQKNRQGEKTYLQVPLSKENPTTKLELIIGLPFYNYQPIDDDMFNFVTDALKLRLLSLELENSLNMTFKQHEISAEKIRQEDKRLQMSFESQRRFWVTWSWPVKTGRGYVNEETTVPPVDGVYDFDFIEGLNNRLLDFSSNMGNESVHQLISHKSKLATGFVWKSFIANIRLISSSNNKQRKKDFMSSYDEAFLNLRRLPIFRLLSSGKGIPGGWLPHMKCSAHLSNSYDVPDTIIALLEEWTSVKDHYEKSQGYPLRCALDGNEETNPLDSIQSSFLRHEYNESSEEKGVISFTRRPKQ